MDIMTSLAYDARLTADVYAAKVNQKESRLATGHKVAAQAEDAASLQITAKTEAVSEAAQENINSVFSSVEDVARAETMIQEASRRILENADDSVLAQANQATNVVSKLLN